MTTLESLVLSYLANALWQLPLVFAAGWLAARAVHRLGSAAEHRVWVCVLLLQVFLPAVSVVPWQVLPGLLGALLGNSTHDGQAHVAVIVGPGILFGGSLVHAWLLVDLAIAYGTVTAWFTARFMWRLEAVRRICRSAVIIAPSGGFADHWKHCSGRFKVRHVSLGTSQRVYGPITIGIRRKLILLPQEMLVALPDAELRTAISHEFAHICRHDFLKNLLYEFISIPARFHPFLILARSRLMETREMVCDQMAINLAERRQYARSLLRLASLLANQRPSTTPHAIGIFDSSALDRRIMRLTEKQTPPSAERQLISAIACLLLAAGVCAVALSSSIRVNAEAAGGEQTPSGFGGLVNVNSSVMQKQITHQVPPIYPNGARKAGIQGTVQLDAVIGRTGKVEQLKVVSGPKELQNSALVAVQQWTYKPFLLNGEPVKVKTTFNIVFSLAKRSGESKGSTPYPLPPPPPPPPPPPSNQ